MRREMARNARATAVPKAAQVQLGRLFGSTSVEALKQTRTVAEWKRTLRKTLHELESYIIANIDTDELHANFVASGLFAAEESLKEENFWPGYAEGLTRIVLTLLGDYPDHRRRKGGAKASGHYGLQLYRSLHYTQSSEQRFRTLLGAGRVFGTKRLSRPPQEVLDEFRSRFGNQPDHAHFLRWYKKNFPADYTAVFS
jgi:hypothetical protein